MARTPYKGYKYKEPTIRRVIWKANGIIKDAAALLGMSRQRFCEFVDEFALWDEVDLACAEMLDEAENQLHKQIKKGNLTAIMFYLKCKGKDRGYVERFIPQSSSKDQPQNVNLIITNPNEETKQIEKGNGREAIQSALPTVRSMGLLNRPQDN